tara:strand:- start:21316 stop:22401 length:1086 start_codon:yes stop_codon:yes gene_type:complete
VSNANASSIKKAGTARLGQAKWAFSTRLCTRRSDGYIRSDITPAAGDLCLARVVRLGHHQRLELATGRRAHLYPGDEIVIAYGNRYAVDQFDAVVPDSLKPCDLAAAGGVAGTVRSRHSRTRQPTRIEPIGLLCDAGGETWNLNRFRTPIPLQSQAFSPSVIAVTGAGMNSGKTTTASAMVHSLKKAGLRVAAIKLTGTGSGGDLWQFLDAGADHVYDFTNAGYVSTCGLGLPELTTIIQDLIALASTSHDVIIAEVADGLLQTETELLLKSEAFRQTVDAMVFAAGDAMAAAYGVARLSEIGFTPSFVSGLVTASELSRVEAEQACGLPVLTLAEILAGDHVLPLALQTLPEILAAEAGR